MDQAQLWNKFSKSAGKIGRSLIHQALLLYYAYPRAPKKVKAVIASTLAYFIFPIDLIPDPIPVLGFLDDATLLAGALLIVRFYVNEEVRQKASETLKRFIK